MKGLTPVKKQWFAILCALLLIPALSGCSVKDLFLYLYGGDEWVDASGDPVWMQYDAPNGVTVLYDSNIWERPAMAQEDTVSITAGNQLDYTAILLQVTDGYTDFLTQSGEELSAETGTVEYGLDFTIPDGQVEAVRYDCGSYQTIFAELQYDSGLTVYVSAATRSSDYEPIMDLLQTVYPTGQTPESAREASTQASPVPQS